MRCSKCGFECGSEAKFCPKCGAMVGIIPKLVIPEIEVVQESSTMDILPSLIGTQEQSSGLDKMKNKTPQPQAKKRIKYSVIGGGILILVIIVISIITSFISHESNYVHLSKDQLMLWQGVLENRETAYCVTDRTGKKVASLMEQPMHVSHSLDNSVIAYENQNSDFYVITKDGSREVADRVSEFVISEDGTQCAYIIYDEERMSIGDLFLYDITKETTRLVAKNCHIDSLAISPNGDSLAFVKDYEGRTDYKLCVSIGGMEYETVEKNKTPVAISNHGEFLYYVKKQGLYVKSNKGTRLLTSGFTGEMTFNCDYSQIIFEEDGRLFISVEGNQRQELSNLEFRYLILPDGVASNTTVLDNIVGYGRGYKTVYGVYELTNQVCLLEDYVCYIDDKLKVYKICPKGITDLKISSNGREVAYAYFGCLYLVSNLTNEEPKHEKITRDIGIKRFVAANDFGHFYYINSYEILFSVDKYGERTELHQKVDGSCPYKDDTEDIIYFFQNAKEDYGALYYCKGTGKKKKVKDANCVKLDGYTSGLCYLTVNDDGTYNKYILHGGDSTLIFENLLKDY